MAIDPYDPDRHRESGEAGWRAPRRCYTRPEISESMRASRLYDTDSNAHVLAFSIVLIAIWCVSSFLILQNGWSF